MFCPKQKAFKGITCYITIMYNNKFRKGLFEKINTMSKTEHEEIFKIIKDNNSDITYSKNKNGIFFNLSSLSEPTINEINKFVDYCICNKQELDDYDKKINECKINNNFANIVTLEDAAPTQTEQTEDWNAIVGNDLKSIQKISTFIEKIMNDHDRIGKKKINQKFSNAKKKYSKRVCVEKKFETEDNTELTYDQYIIT